MNPVFLYYFVLCTLHRYIIIIKIVKNIITKDRKRYRRHFSLAIEIESRIFQRKEEKGFALLMESKHSGTERLDSGVEIKQ